MDAPTSEEIRTAALRLRLTLDTRALRGLEMRLAAAADATARLAEAVDDGDTPATVFGPGTDL